MALRLRFALCALLARRGAAAGEIPRIGVWNLIATLAQRVRLEAFRQGFAELGWMEEKNIAIEYRVCGGKKIDICVSLRRSWFVFRLMLSCGASTGAKLLAAKSATPYHSHRDDNLFRTPWARVWLPVWPEPGGNVTGMSGLAVELNTKRLELLKDDGSKLARVRVFPTRMQRTGAIANELQSERNHGSRL